MNGWLDRGFGFLIIVLFSFPHASLSVFHVFCFALPHIYISHYATTIGETDAVTEGECNMSQVPTIYIPAEFRADNCQLLLVMLTSEKPPTTRTFSTPRPTFPLRRCWRTEGPGRTCTTGDGAPRAGPHRPETSGQYTDIVHTALWRDSITHFGNSMVLILRFWIQVSDYLLVHCYN